MSACIHHQYKRRILNFCRSTFWTSTPLHYRLIYLFTIWSKKIFSRLFVCRSKKYRWHATLLYITNLTFYTGLEKQTSWYSRQPVLQSRARLVWRSLSMYPLLYEWYNNYYYRVLLSIKKNSQARLLLYVTFNRLNLEC